MTLRGFSAAALFLLAICSFARTESFFQKILRITGISATPSQQKASGEEMAAGGEIWLADIKTNSVRKLSNDSGFHSPIFSDGDRAILAIKNGALFRLSLADGASEELHPVANLIKLVGTDRDDFDKILVLLERTHTPRVALLSLATGTITEVTYDSNSADDRKLVQHLKGWEHVYGETKIFCQAQTRESPAGAIEWNDVFLKRGDASPINISRCEGDICGQPALSHDGSKVVFVRAKQ